jgi:putative MATE family efflux protein
MNFEINETIIHGVERKQKNDPVREMFLKKPLNGLIIKNALPAIASMMFMALYQMVDGIMVGQRLGPNALAAVNILYPILALFIGLAVMIGVGGNARIAVLLGSGDSKRASKVLGLVFLLGLSLGLIGTLIIILQFGNILKLLGTHGEVGSLAGEYLSTLCWFFPSLILFFILEQSLRNDGKANLASSIMLIFAFMNIFLDYLFLYPLNMGVSGAALATGISQSIGAIIFSIYFLRKSLKKLPGLRFSLPIFEKSVFSSIIVNGSSELFNSLAMGVTTFLFNRIIISRIGMEGVAAFALVQYFTLFGVTIFLGLNNGCQPIISYNHGAKLNKRVEKTLYKLLFVSIILGVIFFVILQLFSGFLIKLFISDVTTTKEITVTAAKYISFSLIIMPLGIIGSMFFTSLENAKYSLLISFSRSLLFIIIGLSIFPYIFGDTGIWLTPFFAEFMTGIVTIFLMYRWKNKIKLEVKNENLSS